MRRRLTYALMPILLLLVGAYLAAWLFAGKRSDITPEGFARLSSGMTLAEMETTLGSKPGDYRTMETSLAPCGVGASPILITGDIAAIGKGKRHTWVSNQGWIHAEMNREGRLAFANWEPAFAPAEPPALEKTWQQVRMFFGGN